MSTTVKVELCPVCSEIFDNPDDARLCCAPEARVVYECSRCARNDHKTQDAARMCCQPPAVPAELCSGCYQQTPACQC